MVIPFYILINVCFKNPWQDRCFLCFFFFLNEIVIELYLGGRMSEKLEQMKGIWEHKIAVICVYFTCGI